MGWRRGDQIDHHFIDFTQVSGLGVVVKLWDVDEPESAVAGDVVGVPDQPSKPKMSRKACVAATRDPRREGCCGYPLPIRARLGVWDDGRSKT